MTDSGASPRLGRCRLGIRLSRPEGPGVYAAALEGSFGATRPVWVERLSTEDSRSPKAISAFIEEGQRRARFEHPVLLETLELAQAEDGEPFLIVADPRGPDLSKVLAAEGRALPLPLAIHLALELGRALDELELDAQFAGRLEPGRVFVSGHGEVRMTFGPPVRSPRELWCYQPPEIAAPGARVDPINVFGLATLLFEASSGVLPAQGDGAFLPPQELTDLLSSALRPDPSARPTLRAFRDRLENILDGLVSSHKERVLQLRSRASLLAPPTLDLEAPPRPPTTPPRKPPRRDSGAQASDLLMAGRFAPVLGPSRSPPPRSAARSYWFRTAGLALGPFTGAGLFEQLEALSLSALSEAQVSTDGLRFIPSARFFELLGEDLPPAESPLHHLAPSGSLAKDPLLGVLARLAKAKATGRLIVVRHDDGFFDRREVHLEQGDLVHATSLSSTLRLWQGLLKGRRFGGTDLVGSVHRATHENLLMGPSLKPAVVAALAHARALETRRLLRDLLSWRSGEYGFDEGARPRVGRRTPLLPLLPRALYRALDLPSLRARLAAHFDRVLEPRAAIDLAAFKLRPSEVRRVESFGGGRTLAECLGANHGFNDERSGLSLALFCVDLGLLESAPTPRPAPRAQSSAATPG